MAVIGISLLNLPPPPPPPPHHLNHRHLHSTSSLLRLRRLSQNATFLFKFSNSRINATADSSVFVKPEIIQTRANDIEVDSLDNKIAINGNSFLSVIGVLLGVAAVITLVLAGMKPLSLGTSTGLQFLKDASSSSTSVAFSFRAFGYTVVLPQYTPGWIYFWLLMAAGCGLFISEEALNIWVGISLARLLTLDGTWQSILDSFSRNAPYIISTVLWVYWGVCISDMIPFYLGKFLRHSGASDDIRSKLGVGKEKAMEITNAVQRYGNLIGFGYITRLFLCWSLLWWTDHSSTTVGNWVLAERTTSICSRNCCHCSGNLDSVSVCFGCTDCAIPLSKKPLFQLALFKFLCGVQTL